MVTIAADASLRMARHKRRAHFVELVHRRGDERVASWTDFYAAMAERKLLARLDDYPDALLIAGCDWSATTAITRLFKRLPCFADSSWGHDDELDGALLLANGAEDVVPGRHCFQTTYLRERYREYFEHERFKLVWIIREPRSAVRSLLASRDRDGRLGHGFCNSAPNAGHLNATGHRVVGEAIWAAVSARPPRPGG